MMRISSFWFWGKDRREGLMTKAAPIRWSWSESPHITVSAGCGRDVLEFAVLILPALSFRDFLNGVPVFDDAT